jgi:hypothetical protein
MVFLDRDKRLSKICIESGNMSKQLLNKHNVILQQLMSAQREAVLSEDLEDYPSEQAAKIWLQLNEEERNEARKFVKQWKEDHSV